MEIRKPSMGVIVERGQHPPPQHWGLTEAGHKVGRSSRHGLLEKPDEGLSRQFPSREGQDWVPAEYSRSRSP